MTKQKIISDYTKTRDNIIANKNITENRRNTELFINWINYVTSFAERSRQEEVQYIQEATKVSFNYQNC